MRVFLQVIDTKTAVYQVGMIDEPVIKGKEVDNALAHFGVTYGNVDWVNENFGKVEGTSKVVTIVKV